MPGKSVPRAAADADANTRIRVHGDQVALRADSDGAPLERESQLERVPTQREQRVQRKHVTARPYARESEDECLPQAAHRRQVAAARDRPGEVVEIDAAGEPQRRQRLVE